ncbi:MAG: hypothetical protein ACQERF_12475 [Actinomycetota bacterium]
MNSPYRSRPLDLRIPPPVIATGAAAAQWLLTRRNPMCVGMALELVGLAAYHGRVLALPPIPAYTAYLQRFQIGPEERALRDSPCA